jgi:hypothetical protein
MKNCSLASFVPYGVEWSSLSIPIYPLHAMVVEFFTLYDNFITAGFSVFSISTAINAFKIAVPDFIGLTDEIVLPLYHYVLRQTDDSVPGESLGL